MDLNPEPTGICALKFAPNFKVCYAFLSFVRVPVKPKSTIKSVFQGIFWAGLMKICKQAGTKICQSYQAKFKIRRKNKFYLCG